MHVYKGCIGGLLENTVHCILTLEVTVSALFRHDSPPRRDGSGQLHGKPSVLGPGLRCAGSCCTNDALHRSSTLGRTFVLRLYQSEEYCKMSESMVMG